MKSKKVMGNDPKIWKDTKGMTFLQYQNKVYVLVDDVQKSLLELEKTMKGITI